MLTNLNREIIYSIIRTRYSNDLFYAFGLMRDTNYRYETIKEYMDELEGFNIIEYVKTIGRSRMYKLTNNAITNIKQ